MVEEIENGVMVDDDLVVSFIVDGIILVHDIDSPKKDDVEPVLMENTNRFETKVEVANNPSYTPNFRISSEINGIDMV